MSEQPIIIKKNKGFTLSEIMVSVIIVGVLAGLAAPRMGFMIEKSRVSEGLNITDALRNAQIAHELEFGFYATSYGDLDVEIPVGAGNFPSADFQIIDPLDPATDPVVKVERAGGDYILEGYVDGDIVCDDAAGIAGICTRLGLNL